jgi:hypothetical protein
VNYSTCLKQYSFILVYLVSFGMCIFISLILHFSQFYIHCTWRVLLQPVWYTIFLCAVENSFVQSEFQTCPIMDIHTECGAIQDFLRSLLELPVTRTAAWFLNGCPDFWSWWCRGRHDSGYIWITTTEQGHPCFPNTAPAKVNWFVTCDRNK